MQLDAYTTTISNLCRLTWTEDSEILILMFNNVDLLRYIMTLLVYLASSSQKSISIMRQKKSEIYFKGNI